MGTRRARPEPDDWPETVLVDEADRIWDDKLGHHRCPLGLIQTPRTILECREITRDGGLKLYVQQLEREGICDVAVVDEDEHEVWIQVVTCCYDHLRVKYPRIVIGGHKWYELPPLQGRSVIDAETGEEVRVHRLEDHARGHGNWSPDDRDGTTDPDLDIPF